jgi:hypothetical protein
MKYSASGKCYYDCTVCGGRGTLTVERRADGRYPFYIDCFKASCHGGGGEYLRDLAALVGAPGGGALLADPLRYLGEPVEQAANGKPAKLPSEASLAGWRSRLFSDSALDYLEDECGLTRATIIEFEIGLDDEAHVFPVRDEQGDNVQVVRRANPEPWAARSGKPIRYKVLKGHSARLYPQPLPERGWLLVGGLLDAIIGRQHGLPTVTSICGTSFPQAWEPLVCGRKVFVMYDVGEELTTHSRAMHLRTAGADAYAVRLNRLLRRGQGKDLRDALTNGYTARDIIELINRERRVRRRKARAR